MAGARRPGPIGMNPGESFQWVGVGAPRGAVSFPGTIGAPLPIGSALAQKHTRRVAIVIDYEELYSDLLRWEGKVAYMYLRQPRFRHRRRR